MTRKHDEERSFSTRNAKKEEEKEEEKKKEEQKGEKEKDQNTLCQISKWSTLRPLLITCYLHFVQNWCGVNVIVFKVSL